MFFDIIHDAIHLPIGNLDAKSTLFNNCLERGVFIDDPMMINIYECNFYYDESIPATATNFFESIVIEAGLTSFADIKIQRNRFNAEFRSY